MAIVNPETRLSRADKELLLLLGGLVSDCEGREVRNHNSDEVPLSDSEAARLIELLEELVQSKKFIEAAYFVEELSRGRDADIKSIQRIFASWRSRNGRAKSMSWLHWNEFLRRFSSDIDPGPADFVPKVKEMQFAYFLRMESVLLSALPLTPRVRSLVLEVVKKFEAEIDSCRRGQTPLPRGFILQQPSALLAELRSGSNTGLGLSTFSASQIVGIITLVADSAVLFTTRDWGVAGTFSTMAGAIAAADSK